MKIYKNLKINIKGLDYLISFGSPENKEELNEIYEFRFKEYLSRGYINPVDFKEEKDVDEYDDGRSVYFLAKCNNNIVATIRLIQDEVLPAEKSFKFDEPDIIKKISRDKRFELGRFIIVPIDKEKKIFLPRQLAMITVFSVIFEYAKNNNLIGGYSFVKTSLLKKLIKINTPIISINNYKQVYKEDGVLYNYFSQENDKVVPIAFLVSDFKRYIEKIFSNKLVFLLNENDIIVKNNIITKFLLFFRLF